MAASINVALQANGGVATATSSNGSNLPSNINNGDFTTGNGRNWTGNGDNTNPRVMITFNNIYSINKIRLETTDNWGYAFSDFDVYYSIDDSVKVNDDLSNFTYLGHFSSRAWVNAIGSVEFLAVNAKKVLIVCPLTLSAISELEIYSTPFNVNTSINAHDLKIGDAIPYKYTASTSGNLGIFNEVAITETSTAMIPATTSSPTPDGLFYWIYVGKDYLGRKKFIADRNIQHSISWDTLNSEGVVEEVPIYPYLVKATTPVVGGSNDPRVIYSAQKSDNPATNAFDDIDATGWNCGQTTGWIGYIFDSPKRILKYSIVGPDWGGYTQCPKNFSLQGSNDGGATWVTIDTQTGITWSGTGNLTKDFYVSSPAAFLRYRLNITANNGHSTTVSVYELRLFEAENKNYNYSIKLLTGGTSATDTDNEWDKIIVNSTLGGTINAGDDNIWHWNQLRSITSTTSPANGASTRVVRGSLTENNVSQWGYNTSSYSATNYGFRPVLLIEALTSSINIENIKLNIINTNFDINITSDGITHEDNKPIKYKVSIIKPDNSVVIKHDYDTDYSETPFNLPAISFNQNEFDNGNNTIVIDVTDINGNTNTWTFNITKTSLNKILIIDGNNLKYVLNNNLTLLDSDYVDLDENKLVNYLMINGSDKDIKINNLKSQCENIDNLKLLIFNTNVLN